MSWSKFNLSLSITRKLVAILNNAKLNWKFRFFSSDHGLISAISYHKYTWRAINTSLQYLFKFTKLTNSIASNESNSITHQSLMRILLMWSN